MGLYEHFFQGGISYVIRLSIFFLSEIIHDSRARHHSNMLLSNSARSSEKGKYKKQDQLCTWTLLAIAGNLQKKLSGLFLDKEGKRECEVRRKTEAGRLLFCSSKGKV